MDKGFKALSVKNYVYQRLGSEDGWISGWFRGVPETVLIIHGINGPTFINGIW
jgi:hypothetical protein